MAVKRTRKLLVLSQPTSPAEAAEWLAKLCEQMEYLLDEYRDEPDESVVSFELVQWFVAAVRKGGSLERALGLRRGKGRPKVTGPGKHFQVIRQAFILKELQRKSWKTVCDKLNFLNQRELQKIYKRERPKVLRGLVDELVRRLERRALIRRLERRALNRPI